MNEETFGQKLVHALVFLAICAAIVAIGWHEPLRYRFMSPEEIYAIEHPKVEVEIAPPDVGAWMRESSRKTMLDQPATSVQGGGRSQSMGSGRSR